MERASFRASGKSRLERVYKERNFDDCGVFFFFVSANELPCHLVAAYHGLASDLWDRLFSFFLQACA